MVDLDMETGVYHVNTRRLSLQNILAMSNPSTPTKSSLVAEFSDGHIQALSRMKETPRPSLKDILAMSDASNPRKSGHIAEFSGGRVKAVSRKDSSHEKLTTRTFCSKEINRDESALIFGFDECLSSKEYDDHLPSQCTPADLQSLNAKDIQALHGVSITDVVARNQTAAIPSNYGNVETPSATGEVMDASYTERFWDTSIVESGSKSSDGSKRIMYDSLDFGRSIMDLIPTDTLAKADVYAQDQTRSPSPVSPNSQTTVSNQTTDISSLSSEGRYWYHSAYLKKVCKSTGNTSQRPGF